MFTEEALKSDMGQEFIRLYMSGMPVAKALDAAFGEGATAEMARRIWVSVRCKDVIKKAGY